MPLELAKNHHSDTQLRDNLSVVLKELTHGKVKVSFNMTSLDVLADHLNKVFELEGSEKVDRRKVLVALHDEAGHHFGIDAVKTLNAFENRLQDQDDFVKIFEAKDRMSRDDLGAAIVAGVMGAGGFGCLTLLGFLYAGLHPMLMFPAGFAAVGGLIVKGVFNSFKKASPKTRQDRAMKAFNEHQKQCLSFLKGVEKNFEYNSTNKKLSIAMPNI